MRAIQSWRISRLRRRRSRNAYARAWSTASFAGLKSSFFERRKPLARSRIALCLRWAGTPRLILAIDLYSQGSADFFAVGLGDGLLVFVVALSLLGFVLEKVALPGARAHELSVLRHSDPLGKPLAGLDLRHWRQAPSEHVELERKAPEETEQSARQH